MTSGDELLSCPFCGGAAEVREWDFPYVRFQARCVECKTTGRTRFNERAKAIAAWNHRTPPTPATDERALLERVFRHGFSDGWRSNQTGRQSEPLAASGAWHFYVADGALQKSVALTANHSAPVVEE